MSKIIALMFSSIISLTCFCSVIDTTIFESDFEKSVFQKVSEGKLLDSVDLFFSMAYSDQCESFGNRIIEFNKSLKNKINSQSGLKKQFQIIYKSVHSEFFKKYNEKALFNDIFTTGEYNCVTATALYSIILDFFHISYEIKETTSHVYLIADPGKTSFMIETTMPAGGLTQFTVDFKKDYLEYLNKNKLISDEEFKNGDFNQLFNKFYISDESISLKELAGLHYYNKGVFQTVEKKYEEALKSFEKAELLYNSNRIKYSENYVLANLLDNDMLQKSFHSNILAKFLNCNVKDGSVIQYGKQYFDIVAKEMLINHPDSKNFNKYFSDFKLNLNDSIDRKDFDQIFYSYSGYSDYANFNYPGAIYNLAKSYKINPDNVQTKQLLSEVTLKYLVGENRFESRIDSIELYFDRFNFLQNDKTLQQFFVYCYARVISTCYEFDNTEKGSQFFQKFEALSLKYPNIEINEEYIESIYGQVASYYVRKQKYDLAEKILKKGIEIAPNSSELNRRLKNVVESYMGKSYNYNYAPVKNESTIIKQYLTNIKNEISEINENVNKYICGKCVMEKVEINGTMVNFPGDIKFTMMLTDSKKAIVNITGEKNENGIWSYNEKTCTLTMRDIIEGDDMCMIISEIDDTHILCLMYSPEDLSEAHEVYMKAESK